MTSPVLFAFQGKFPSCPSLLDPSYPVRNTKKGDKIRQHSETLFLSKRRLFVATNENSGLSTSPLRRVMLSA